MIDVIKLIEVINQSHQSDNRSNQTNDRSSQSNDQSNPDITINQKNTEGIEKCEWWRGRWEKEKLYLREAKFLTSQLDRQFKVRKVTKQFHDFSLLTYSILHLEHL